MSSNGKQWVKVFSVLLLLGTAVIFAAGAAVYSAGTLSVRVHEKKPGGVDLTLPVPVALIDAGMAFIPDEDLREIDKNVGALKPVIEQFLSGLERCPDGPFLQTKGQDGTVSILKRGRKLIIDVDSKDASVHLSLPLRSLREVIGKLCRHHRGRVEI